MQPYPHPYEQVYSGADNLRGNPKNNLCDRFRPPTCRLRLVIWARPCPGQSSDKHRAPTADPSLPTTEEGISARGCKNIYKERDRRDPNFDNSRINNHPTQITD